VRLNLRDFLGGPPTQQGASERLSPDSRLECWSFIFIVSGTPESDLNVYHLVAMLWGHRDFGRANYIYLNPERLLCQCHGTCPSKTHLTGVREGPSRRDVSYINVIT
jgi:hypothetical protein